MQQLPRYFSDQTGDELIEIFNQSSEPLKRKLIEFLDAGGRNYCNRDFEGEIHLGKIVIEPEEFATEKCPLELSYFTAPKPRDSMEILTLADCIQFLNCSKMGNGIARSLRKSSVNGENQDGVGKFYYFQAKKSGGMKV